MLLMFFFYNSFTESRGVRLMLLMFFFFITVSLRVEVLD